VESGKARERLIPPVFALEAARASLPAAQDARLFINGREY
jgi:hypothetical protein